MQSNDDNDYAARFKGLYGVGPTPVYTCKHDPRFSYCMYIPPSTYDLNSPTELVVVVHGTVRSFMQYRDVFSEFGRWNNCVILAPLFPIGPFGDDNGNGYKELKERDLRYDLVMLEIIKEASARLGRTFDRFALTGYSGGGQFANRFGLLHPEKLWALSIGAPGMITVPDRSKRWWLGVGDIEEKFGISLNLEALRQLPVQMFVGKADIETWEITLREDNPRYIPGCNDTGATRPERLRTLQRAFEEVGIAVRFDLLNNVAHDTLKSSGVVADFFSDVLAKKRKKS